MKKISIKKNNLTMFAKANNLNHFEPKIEEAKTDSDCGTIAINLIYETQSKKERKSMLHCFVMQEILEESFDKKANVFLKGYL